MEELKGKDLFGNEYTETMYEDGRVKRCTQTNRKSRFDFLGDVYTWIDLRHLPTIKTYVDEYHQEIKLCRDKCGRLLLYFYDEYMNFNGDDDRVDYLWVVVKDENDAEELSEAHRFSRLRVPYIAADEKGWMAAHQIII